MEAQSMNNLKADDIKRENQRLAASRVTTADRLKQILAERGIRQADILRLCKPYAEKYRIKIGSNDMSQYVTGKVEPGQTKLFILAKALRVNEAWLMGFDVDRTYVHDDEPLEPEDDTIKHIHLKKFPMLGDIACGSPIEVNREYETFVSASDSINADFCLTAKGDSMINARIFDGDIVFIRQQPTVNNGEIAAVAIENEVTLKRVYLYDNRIELRPENPTYPALNYEGEQLDGVRIIGKAVAFQSFKI